MYVPIMAVCVYYILLAQMELMELMETDSSLGQELTADSSLVSSHEELANTSAQETGETEPMKQLAPTIPTNTSHNVYLGNGNGSAQGGQSVTIMSGGCDVVTLLEKTH